MTITFESIKAEFLQRIDLGANLTSWPPFQALLDDIINAVLSGQLTNNGRAVENMEDAFKVVARTVVAHCEANEKKAEPIQRVKARRHTASPWQMEYVFGLN